ncbi:MAG: acetyl-CoA decarbonylase/synthase complex subunit delta [Dehalococcoidia bacterium]|nr:acetyl-CoA decarbonylase/synthase complex subunit delta [Dehalococcoidia bacterium]
MAIEFPSQKYNGQIKTITLGDGSNAVSVGRENCFPFYLFEGNMPNSPRIAMEIYDLPPTNWPATLLQPFADVIDDPLVWAQKCVNEFGAEMLCLKLVSTDPNGENKGAEQAAATVKRVAAGIDVPLIVWGTANRDKDSAVLKLVCETCQDKPLIIGPVEEGNYKSITPAAVNNGHIIVASSSMDINLAKQLNILLANSGVPTDKILIDPTVSSIGYGIEYCYSVIERIRLAAITQADDKLAYPIVLNIAEETWKTKEANTLEDCENKTGAPNKRGIMFEAMSAWLLLLAGGDIAIMRHPEAISLVAEMLRDLQ